MEQASYGIGDLLIYGSTGVCRVLRAEANGPEKGRLYYTLQPLYQTCTIFAPLSDKVFHRHVISREEALALIARVPSICPQPCYSGVVRELTEHYQRLLDTHSCDELMAMTLSIYAKRRWAEEQKRKFGAVDQKFLKRGEDLLFGELAAALEIPREDVPEFLARETGNPDFTIR